MTDDGEPTPLEALENTVWDILKGAYVRAASGGRIPRAQADRNALMRPFLGEMKTDHRALLACIEQGAALLNVSQPPPKPDEDDE